MSPESCRQGGRRERAGRGQCQPHPGSPSCPQAGSRTGLLKAHFHSTAQMFPARAKRAGEAQRKQALSQGRARRAGRKVSLFFFCCYYYHDDLAAWKWISLGPESVQLRSIQDFILKSKCLPGTGAHAHAQCCPVPCFPNPTQTLRVYPARQSGVPGSSCHNNKEFSIIGTKNFHPFLVFDAQILPTPHLL